MKRPGRAIGSRLCVDDHKGMMAMATRRALDTPMRELAVSLRQIWPSLTVAALGLGFSGAVLAQAAPILEAQAAPAAPAASVTTKDAASGDDSTRLEDITVTSTRRSEKLSTVPISVSAYSQETLDAKGAKDFTDVVRFTPGVTIDANGTNSISIRGISSSAGAGTTGIYIDDTPIQMRALSFYSNDTLPEAFDLDRIEVLRGPQGTLFGAGAEGGAVRYILAQPNMVTPSTYARTELAFTQGGAPSYEAGVAYGAPIIENELGFRASLWYRNDGGWIDNINPAAPHDTTEKNANYSNDMVLRLAAKWIASDELTITPSMLYQNRNTHDETAYWPIFSNPSSNSYKNADFSRIPQPDHYFLPAIKVEYDLGSASIYSNTSYYTRFDQTGYDGTLYNLSFFQTFNSNGEAPMNPGFYPLLDGTGSHLPPSLQYYRAPAVVTNQLRSFAQEFRLQSNDPKAPLVWTTGVFFSVNRQSSVEEINDPGIGNLFQAVFAPPFNDYTQFFGSATLPNKDSFYSYNFSQDRQVAAFGEATYALTSQLKATIGVRYSKTDVDFANYANGPQNFGLSGGSGSEHETPITPKASLAYQPDRDDMFYATYAKGFRIGGANAPIPSQACPQDLANLGLTTAPDSYNSDSVNSYELGAKNKLGDDLRMASSIYYVQWQGIQQIVFLPICGFQFTSNFGNAVAKGADLQLEYSPSSAWAFDMALGYTDAKYSTNAGTGAHLIAAAGDSIEGASVTPAPPWTLAVGAQYNFGWQDRKSFLRVDYQYAGRSNVPTASEDPRTSQFDSLAFTPKASSFVSIRAGTTVNKWNISAFIDNLFDAHPEIPPSAFPHTQIDIANPNPPSAAIRAYTFRPRTIGVTATFRN
jgi:iron complex outermembrane receptor protein